MTKSDGMCELLDAFPGRSVCLEIQAWSHFDGRCRHSKTVYLVSVIPGPNGRDCQRFEGASIAECVRAALLHACDSPETQAEDAEFEPLTETELCAKTST